MANSVVKIRNIKVTDTESYQAIMLWCPGCEERNPERRRGGLNLLPITGDPEKRPTWTFNGNIEKPTITPSILVRYPIGDVMLVCHSFVTDGNWLFLSDCTHDLKDQVVPMVPLPDWCIKE